MSRWWFARTASVVPNHLRDDDPESLPTEIDWEALGPRSMRVVGAERIDVECVVRGYLAGSGWKEYREHGTLAEEPLPLGLRESSRLSQPLFTPASKNDEGHDENISRAHLADVVGAETAALLEEKSLALYTEATRVCADAGMILADTKFEFGWVDGVLTLIDEVLTPDSSRFWDAAIYREGEPQPAFDKQFLRDWLEASGWNKQPPGPELPDDVVAHTRSRYLEAARRICGLELE
jgi:phosphoribosylaminoimidazole-succinocarboxamide synthase